MLVQASGDKPHSASPSAILPLNVPLRPEAQGIEVEDRGRALNWSSSQKRSANRVHCTRKHWQAKARTDRPPKGPWPRPSRDAVRDTVIRHAQSHYCTSLCNGVLHSE